MIKEHITATTLSSDADCGPKALRRVVLNLFPLDDQCQAKERLSNKTIAAMNGASLG